RYSHSYYCDWGEDEKLLFSDENKIDFNTLESITDESVKRKIFYKEMYEKYNILTSEGIQTRYKEIVRRRKSVEVITDYLLIDDINEVIDNINTSQRSHADNKSTQSKVQESKEEAITDYLPNDDINGTIENINPAKRSHDENKSTQRKVKESKGNNNKQKYLDNVLLRSDEYKRLINEFGQEVIDSKIADLDTYISNKGKNPYKDHNKTLRNWIKKDGTKPLSVKKKEQDRNELIEKMEQLRGSLELPDDYYAMSGTSIDREAVRKELSDIERQLHIN